MSIITRDEVSFGHKCAICLHSPNIEDERQWFAHPDGLQHPMHTECYDATVAAAAEPKCPSCRIPLIARAILLNPPAAQPASLSSAVVAFVKPALQYFNNVKNISTAAGLTLAAYALVTDQRIKGLVRIGESVISNSLNLGPWLGCNLAYWINGSKSNYNCEMIYGTLWTVGVIAKTVNPDISWFYITLGIAAISQFIFNKINTNQLNATNSRIKNKLKPIIKFSYNFGRVYVISALFSLPFFSAKEVLPFSLKWE